MGEKELAHEQITALWVGAFFDELMRWGVRDVVVSPGSRSTALAMAAFELSCRKPADLRLYVDVDERGAAFFALGMAKASGRPVACVCTSGTALANYYPAVVEAVTSRVPLLVLSGDRPPRMQGLGAPQTADQLKAYGGAVRAFRAMPLPGASRRDLAFVRQAAREACLTALGGAASCAAERADAEATAEANAGRGSCASLCAEEGEGVAASDARTASSVQVASRGCERMAGPVQVNFPFEEPLKPDFAAADAYAAAASSGDAFSAGRRASAAADAFGGDALSAEACAGAGERAFALGHVGDAMPAEACAGARGYAGAAVLMAGRTVLDQPAIRRIEGILADRRALVLAGEGTCSTLAEAREVAAWARAHALPLLADPLSGLRSLPDAEVIDNYDNIARHADCPMPDVVIRFGRYPVSKHATIMAAKAATSIVVDVAQTRDFNYATDLFVASTPLDFVRNAWEAAPGARQRDYLQQWENLNEEERQRISAPSAPPATPAAFNSPASSAESASHGASGSPATGAGRNAPAASFASAASDQLDDPCYPQGSRGRGPCDAFEGSYVSALLDLAPAESCVFVANSMAVRALDTFYLKSGKPLCVLCNRGQNGIDGTVSTALGAAQHFTQTTFLTGDFTLLHDLNALALRRELDLHHQEPARSIVIVLLNNNGGAIFDMLPQASDDAYFERLFLVPQDVSFEHAARTFGVTYRRVSTVAQFSEAYASLLGTPGISLVEVAVPLRGVKERYERYHG